METLLDALMRYAEENLVVRYERETAARTKAALLRADQLTRKLAALGPEAEVWVEALKEEWDAANNSHNRAILLSGISIGLELGWL